MVLKTQNSFKFILAEKEFSKYLYIYKPTVGLLRGLLHWYPASTDTWVTC
jgi:hypothetical protein